VKAIQLASYVYINRQIVYLQEQIRLAMGNRIDHGTPFLSTSNETQLMNMSAVNTLIPPNISGQGLGQSSSTANAAKVEEGDLIQF